MSDCRNLSLTLLLGLALLINGCSSDPNNNHKSGDSIERLMAKQTEMSWYAPLYFAIIDRSREYYKLNSRQPTNLEDLFPSKDIPVNMVVNGKRQVVYLDKKKVDFQVHKTDKKNLFSVSYRYNNSSWIEKVIDLTGDD